MPNDVMTLNQDLAVENNNLKVFLTGLASAINETYSYTNNSMFYALLPSYMRDYAYRYIRPACQWLDGYVPSIHYQGSNLLSTRIASKLITGLTKQIVGEKLIFKIADKNDTNARATLDFVNKWAEENNILKAVYSGVGYALGIGTSLLKMNKTIDHKIWWEACRFDTCFYLADGRNEVREATFLIKNYVDSRQNKSDNQYFLVEHRYYKPREKADMLEKLDGTFETIHPKGELIPMAVYQVHKVRGQMLNNVMSATTDQSTVKWQELPVNIRDLIKADYSVIRLDEEVELGFRDLGVVPLLNANTDLSVPKGTNFGESMIIGCQSDLITFDVACSYKLRDMYLAKGTVYQPKNLSMGDLTSANPMMNVGDSKYELIKGLDPETQKMLVEQFEIRGDQWQTIINDCLRNIAVKWGMSPKILSSYLANGVAQMTATQVDSEDDISIAFIYHTRAYFKYALNRMLEETLNFYGKPANITIEFASPSLINKDRLLDRVIKMLENGLIDIEDAMRELYPDMSEDALNVKIEKAKANREAIKQSSVFNLEDDGTFGDNLNGSTNI